LILLHNNFLSTMWIFLNFTTFSMWAFSIRLCNKTW